jgi:hypothetical protein
VLREQPQLAGPVASDPAVSRLVTTLAGDLPRALKAIRSARSAVRGRAWALAGDSAPGGELIDLPKRRAGSSVSRDDAGAGQSGAQGCQEPQETYSVTVVETGVRKSRHWVALK